MASIKERIAKVDEVMETYPDFPKPGINFCDIFPIMSKPEIFTELILLLVEHIQTKAPSVELILGLESRGFILGPLVAQKLGIGFAPVRKAGKLPGETIQASYQLEYGSDKFEVQKAAVKPGQKVIIIDDLLATGGTMLAACQLMQELKADILLCLVVVELAELKGRDKIPFPVSSLIERNA